MTDSLEALAYEEARAALLSQRGLLESIRNRSTAVVSVSAVIVSLPSMNGESLSHPLLAVALALGVFLAIVSLAVLVLRPVPFILDLDVVPLIGQSDMAKRLEQEQDLGGVQRDLALWMRHHYETNQTRVSGALLAYKTLLGLLMLEVLLMFSISV